MIPGIENASPVLTVRSHWLDKDLLPGMTSPTVLTALASFSPRGAPPALNQSLVLVVPGLFHLRVDIGIMIVLSALLASAQWLVRVSLLMAKTSFALNVLRKSSWLTPWNNNKKKYGSKKLYFNICD